MPLVHSIRKNFPCNIPSLEYDKPFRYKAKWVQNESFPASLLECWSTAKAICGDDWVRVIDECGNRLKESSKQTYRNSSKRLWWLKKLLVRVTKMVQTNSVMKEFRRVEAEIHKIRQEYETSAWQMSRPFFFA